MNKFIAGVVVGFVVSCTAVFASPAVEHNGFFWNKLNSSAKSGYINGYGDAMQVSVSKLDYLTAAADLFHWKGANKIIRELSRQLSTADLTPQEAISKLNALYANPKYAELDLGQALQVLAAATPMQNGRAPSKNNAAPPSSTVSK
ncbi:MAG: hypothetical protein ACREQ4_15610 [Candidatus Binataceae bacterium]